MPAAANSSSVPARTAAPTVSEVVARALLRETDAVFGLMGNGNAYFVDAVERLGRGIVPVRHEVATVASADAYYRVTRRLAVATATYGAGYTNTLTALAEAAQARIPLILVAGDQPTTGPRPWDVDQPAIAAAMDVPTVTVAAEDAGPATVAAVADALEHRRPVVLAVPYDLVAAPATEAGARIPGLPAPTTLPELKTGDAARIARALVDAERPLVLAGRGARGAEEDLCALADLLAADVATTAPAQGTFHVERSDETTSGVRFRDLGVCGGFANPASVPELRAADVVLVVGAGLNQFTMAFGEAFGPRARVLQLDLAEAPTHPRVDDHLRTGAQGAVASILRAVRDLVPETAESRSVLEKRPDVEERPAGDDLAADGRLDPRSLLRRIDAALPAERVVATDGGHFIEWAVTYLGVDGPDQMLTVGTQFQSIGLGFPSVPGVVAAAGDRLSVLVSGDGGGLMGIADAETFVRTARRGVVVIMNDGAYGAEVHQYVSKGLAEAPVLIPEVDFAGIFAALGARASTVRTLDDLAEFEEWVASGEDGVFALDCRFSNQVMALHMKEVLAQAGKKK